MKKILFCLFSVAALALTMVGCGDAAPSQAPPITGKPFKKWDDMTKEEKIAALQNSPDPNKAKDIQDVQNGTYKGR